MILTKEIENIMSKRVFWKKFASQPQLHMEWPYQVALHLQKIAHYNYMTIN